MLPRPIGTFGDVRLGLEHSVSRRSGSVAAWSRPRQRTSTMQPVIRCGVYVRVRATAKWWCITSWVPSLSCISGKHSPAVEINSVTWFSRTNTTVATRIKNERYRFSKRSFGRSQRTRATLRSASQCAQRRGHNASTVVAPSALGNSPLPHLSDIESFVVDIENPTHFNDWVRRFKISLQCPAPKISEKEKTMALATKLSTHAFAKFRKCCLPKGATDYS